MNLRHIHRALLTLSCGAAALLSIDSCVRIDRELGSNLIPTNQKYDIYTAEIPITDIYARTADSLSGYSSKRITVGAIRDDLYGLTTRSCALTLIPLHDTLDFGKNAKFRKFHFSAEPDSTSVAETEFSNILQNINVYELSERLDTLDYNINTTLVKHGTKRITKGVPVYNGKDSLSFNFTREFGEKYMTIRQEDLSDFDGYLKKFPGIYISADNPIGNGGRINTFKLQLGLNSSSYYLTSNYAELSFEAEYDGVRKDTSFFFYYGAADFFKIDSLITKGTAGNWPQYCFNVNSQESRHLEGKAEEKIYIEGGGGLKPVVPASEMQRIMFEEIAKHGGKPDQCIINKATIILPFEFPSDLDKMYKFPQILSPTCKIKYASTGQYAYANLTDASSSSENQGDINRSLGQYEPDITYHAQELLKVTDQSKLPSYDIWFLIVFKETEKKSSDESSSALSDYYQQMMYANYYNSLYGGYGGYGMGYGGYGMGYGGYGMGYGMGGYGYGYGYGDYYSNYYSYMMAAAYASQASSSESTTVTPTLDKDRYYSAALNGPATRSGKVPVFRFTYAIPRE